MPAKRDNTLFRPPAETHGLFSEEESSSQEDTQTSYPATARAESLDPTATGKSTGGNQNPAASTAAEEEEHDDFFSEYVHNKPPKQAQTSSASQKLQKKTASSVPPRRSARQQTPVQSQPTSSTGLRRSTRATSQPASEPSSVPVPSYSELHAPQTVGKKRKAAAPPKTTSKSAPKAKKPRVQPKKGRRAVTPAVSEKDAEDFDDDLADDTEQVHPTTGGKSVAPQAPAKRAPLRRGRSATPAISESALEDDSDDHSDETLINRATTGGKGLPIETLATIREVDSDHSDVHSNIHSSTTSHSDNAVIDTVESLEDHTEPQPKLDAKTGTEDTYWVYVVVQVDRRAQGIPGRTILGTYVDKKRATAHMLNRIQRLQKETGGDQFELRSSFGPEGIYQQVVDSQGYGAVAVFIEKELREGVAPQDRVQPTPNWLPRFVYLTIVETRNLESAVVKTHVHEQVYTTLGQANRHAMDVWRLGQMTTEEIQTRNLRAGTMIGGDHEGWVMKRLDELEVEERPFAEKWQLPLGEGPKTEEISIRVHKHEVAGPRN
ncbi:hypothetical protein DTO166G4_7160 [Paecilomyces variotii]|nr:hypothetical protein DTO166G4_7160 [Paecilomyces variotii]KAJ9241527.1 hypothetical protein DTO166G5_1148 [Paecilomyces variotii]KAJ9261933.1 hypothetical protein DTO195F2_3921 [Paecilomyces variotii]KAJ9398838.1 hypothetical protein DTO282F9_4190 [Paecilomyces variotii]